MENAGDAILGGGGNGSVLSISGIASYQPFDGLMELKMVCSNYCPVTSFFSLLFIDTSCNMLCVIG